MGKACLAQKFGPLKKSSNPYFQNMLALGQEYSLK